MFTLDPALHVTITGTSQSCPDLVVNVIDEGGADVPTGSGFVNFKP